MLNGFGFYLIVVCENVFVYRTAAVLRLRKLVIIVVRCGYGYKLSCFVFNCNCAGVIGGDLRRLIIAVARFQIAGKAFVVWADIYAFPL